MKNADKTKPLDPVAVCGHNDPAAVRELLTRIGDKWSIFLVLSLEKLLGGRARFSKLEERYQASLKECWLLPCEVLSATG